MHAENRHVSIMNDKELELALQRIASQIVERCGADERLALIGVRTRGEPLARRLARMIQALEGVEPPVGTLDIGVHRDDAHKPGEGRVYGPTLVDFDIENRQVVLVDDVFFTGRTVRAALDALMDLGRPRRIWLAALIDRGHREFPFRPDFIGKSVPTARHERINVRLREVDADEGVWLEQPEAAS